MAIPFFFHTFAKTNIITKMFNHPKYKHVSYTILKCGNDEFGEYVVYRTNTSNFIHISNISDLDKWFLKEIDKFLNK